MKIRHAMGIALSLLLLIAGRLPAATDAVSLSESYIAQLQLAPGQEVTAMRILQGMDEGLRVPLYDYDELPDGWIFGISPVWVPVEQAIAVRTQQLQAEIASRDPDPVLMQRYAQDIADARQYAQATLNSGIPALATVLTPQQMAALPIWSRLQQVAVLTSPTTPVIIASR